jgi:hypothetical protein
VKESAETNNIMVTVKIGAILTFLVVGGMLVKPANWVPFAPSGFAGIVTGGAIVFFTYIGFDSVSTAAEESRNPQKDLPFGIIMSLVVCTLLYIGVAVVLLGMMKYTTFVSGAAAEAPVAYAMKYLGVHPFFRSVIVIGALTGMISSLLVFQYGQARIWYAMSRDGLLPKLFSAVHPKFKTPYWSTWIACFAVGIPAGLVDIGDAADLANIGTLFAFVLVSLGVIILRRRQPDRKRAFRVPFVPWFPLISVLLCGGLMLGLTLITWLRFVIWLGLGLLIYVLLQPPQKRVREEADVSCHLFSISSQPSAKAPCHRRSAKTLCHPERSRPMSKANRSAQSKDPCTSIRHQWPQGSSHENQGTPLLHPRPRQKQIPLPQLILVRRRRASEKHHRPSVRSRIHRPLRQPRTIRIATARKVRPVFLHRIAELAVLRSPRYSSFGIELSKHILNLRRVKRA